MGFSKETLVTGIVLGGIVAGILFNFLVIFRCDYLQRNESDNITGGNDVRGSYKFGVWQYAIDNAASEYNTQGDCEELSSLFETNELDWKYRMAQVCSILAPCGGLLLLLVTVLRQSCCSVPLGEKLVGLGYSVANVSTALVWLVLTNSVCDTLLGGCEWGPAAFYQLVAQIAYAVASIFHIFLPDPKERQQQQRAHETVAADGSAGIKEENKKDAADRKVRIATTEDIQSQLDAALAQIQKLQDENETTTNLLAAAEETAQLMKRGEEKGAGEKQLTNLVTESKKIQVASPEERHEANADNQANIQRQGEENVKTKSDLATATVTSVITAGPGAARIKKLKEENEVSENELNRHKNESEEASSEAAASKIHELEEECYITNIAMVAATAVPAAAAAVETLDIEKLKERSQDFNEQFRTIRLLQSENDTFKKALAAATATVASHRLEIAELRHEKDILSKELEDSKGDVQKLVAQLDELDDDDNKTKAVLAVATTATNSNSDAEAVEIKKLRKEIDNLQCENRDLKGHLRDQIESNMARMQMMELEMEELNDEIETSRKALIVATAGIGGASVGKDDRIQDLETQVEMLLQQEDEFLKELEQSRQTEELAAEMIQKLEKSNAELRALIVATARSPPSRSVGATVQRDQNGSFGVVESGDPPGFNHGGPSSSKTLQEVLVENHILKAELDMVKAYTQRHKMR